MKNFHDDVVITEVKKMVTGLSKSGGAAGDRGDVNVVRDVVDGGCNGKVLSHRVERESEGRWMKVTE